MSSLYCLEKGGCCSHVVAWGDQVKHIGLYSLHQRMQAPKGGKTQHERFWLNLFLWHSAWTDAFPGDGSWGVGELKQALGNQRLSFFLVHFEQSFQTWGNYPLMFTSACSSSFGNDPAEESWASYVLIQSHINDWAHERHHTTNATKCNCSGWNEQNVAV